MLYRLVACSSLVKVASGVKFPELVVTRSYQGLLASLQTRTLLPPDPWGLQVWKWENRRARCLWSTGTDRDLSRCSEHVTSSKRWVGIARLFAYVFVVAHKCLILQRQTWNLTHVGGIVMLSRCDQQPYQCLSEHTNNQSHDVQLTVSIRVREKSKKLSFVQHINMMFACVCSSTTPQK